MSYDEYKLILHVPVVLEEQTMTQELIKVKNKTSSFLTFDGLIAKLPSINPKNYGSDSRIMNPGHKSIENSEKRCKIPSPLSRVIIKTTSPKRDFENEMEIPIYKR